MPHQSFIARVTSPPGALPFSRQDIRRARHNAYRQLVMQQVTIPILPRLADESFFQPKDLKHQHGVADVDAELTFIFEVQRAPRVVSQYPPPGRDLHAANKRQTTQAFYVAGANV